jgi:DNA-binding FadR family transcriptional regulator
MGIKYENLNTEGLAKQISSKIRDAILEGSLKVADRLPTEEDLAERFGVSRPTIREALKRLAAQNLIHTRRGPSGGSFVKQPSLEEMRGQLSSMAAVLLSVNEFTLFNVVETRHELETLCCRLASSRPQEEMVKLQAQLFEMAAELQRQRDPSLTDVEFCASDVRFHCLIADATHNPMLSFLVTAVIEIMEPVLNLIAYRFRERDFIVARHEEILEGIRAQDPTRTIAALDRMIEYLRQKYAMAQESSGTPHNEIKVS